MGKGTKLEDHIIIVDDVEYVPLSIAKQAANEVFTYDKKLNTEMKKLY